jgi:glycosyltransferase 2 family protein
MKAKKVNQVKSATGHRQPTAKPVDRLSFSPRLQLVLASVLFLASAVFVHDKPMTSPELYIFNVVYNLPAMFTPVFLVITQLGNVYMLLFLGFLMLIKRFYQIALRLFFTGTLAYLLTGVAKDLVGRARPDEFISDLVYRDTLIRGSGFPSGHSAMATAIALTISLYLPPKYKWLAPVTIIGVGLSRIHLGAHGPMDVVGGIAIGWFAVALFKFVQIRLTSRAGL